MRQPIEDQDRFLARYEVLSARGALILASLFGAAFGVIYLDTTTIQIVGYILYPVEYAINLLIFPHATTPLRGNGSALVLLFILTILGALAFTITRVSVVFLSRILRPLTRRPS